MMKVQGKMRSWAAIAAVAALGCTLYTSSAARGQAAAAGKVEAAGLGDQLVAKAAALYYSTAKVGLKGFDCQVHPDWARIMTSARQGEAVAADDPRLMLMSSVAITLHARLDGSTSMDWAVPADPAKPLDDNQKAQLEQAHQGMEQTLVGLLKMWTPLMNGSLAEGLGGDDVTITPSDSGYTVKSKDSRQPVTEEFDKGLVLKRFTVGGAGTNVDLTPEFSSTPQGLLLTSFEAKIQDAGAPAGSGEDMQVKLEYQPVSGMQVLSKVTVVMPKIVEMEFKLDGCVANPK